MVWDYQRHTDCTEDLFRLDILQFEMLYTAYKLFMQVLKFVLSTVTSNVKSWMVQQVERFIMYSLQQKVNIKKHRRWS